MPVLDQDSTSVHVRVSDVDFPFVRDANEVILELISSDGSSQTYPMSMSSMGAPGRSETITETVSVRLPRMHFFAASSFVVKTHHSASEMSYPVRIVQEPSTQGKEEAPEFLQPQSDTAALALIPSFQQNADSTIRFTVRAVRRRIVDSEYFPSSELVRIRIINRKGQIVWSSNDGLAFLTMIYPVEPQMVGGVHDYTLDWNGRTTSGDPVPSGTYTMEVTLPTKPLAYTTSFTISFPLQ